MPTTKRDVLRLIASLPEDASLKEIQYRLHVRAKIECGLTVADRHSGRATDELEKELPTWLACLDRQP
jgi:hypothetical protein